MTKRIDGLVPIGIVKKAKGPSKKSEEVYTSKPIFVSGDELKDMNDLYPSVLAVAETLTEIRDFFGADDI